MSDDEIIQRARTATNGGKFEALWGGDISGYPSQSEADAALCQMLAFWAGGDIATVNRLFKASGLYRDKWDEKRGPDATYGLTTIGNAIANTTEFYNPGNGDYQADIARLSTNGHHATVEGLIPPKNEDGTRWDWVGFDSMNEADPPPAYVLNNAIEKGEVSIFYGTGGSLKSMILADMAVCIANGLNFLPRLATGGGGQTFTTIPHNVLWYDSDNGSRRTRRRFKALYNGHGVELFTGNPVRYTSVPPIPFDAMNKRLVEEMANDIAHHEAGLVIFDNLSRISGIADENSSEMGLVMDGVRRLAEISEAAIFIIHHKGWGDNGRIRGSSRIRDGADSTFEVIRKEDSDLITIRHEKQRDFGVPPFGALWTFEPDEHNRLVTAKFWAAEPEAKAGKGGKLYEAKEFILNHLEQKEGLTQSEFIALLDDHGICSDRTTRKALRELQANSKVKTVKGDKNSIKYYKGFLVW